jgi:hypothetical protein
MFLVSNHVNSWVTVINAPGRWVVVVVAGMAVRVVVVG